MDYTEFFSEHDVAVYKRVKLGTMRLGEIAREETARLVEGWIPESGKQFLHTRRGVFRLTLGGNSDNSTTIAAHLAMGAVMVVVGDESAMGEFFVAHGVQDGVARLKKAMRKRLEMAG